MKFAFYGARFKNKKGEFCFRSKCTQYFVSSFRTDYRIELDGRLVKGRAGDLVIFEPGQIIYHGPAENAAEGFENDWMYIDGEDFSDLLSKYALPKNRPFRINGSYNLGAVIEKIDRELLLGREGADDKCDLIMTDAIIDIYRLYVKGARVSPTDKIERARAEFLQHYERNWTLADMAKLADYSVSRFCSIYKKSYASSPINDLIACRIEKAKLLILYGNMSLSEIAEAVGFSSIYYFSKHFKEKVGIAPSAFGK